MRILLSSVFAACLSNFASAQDNPNTILVMDGSGSMWGQIDGVAKITIAQDVVSGLMETLPADQNIGLTVYGHRERGNCTDIETIVAPGPDTRDAIRDAVNAIKPLGKTPMTDSIIAAAEALRYTEDSATVILVSDGVETCNPDPCAAMRVLEEASIDLTAHVVGFDVGSDAVALEQMQCIADETGGQFLTADNAEELGAALQTVAAEPEPITIPMTFTAVVGDEKRLIESPLLWDINADAGIIAEDLQENPLNFDVEEGSYVATAYSLELEQTVNVNFVAVDGGNTMVEAVFEEPAPTARLIAPETALLGDTIDVGWDGPGGDRDFVGVSEVGENGYINYGYTRDGNPTKLKMPPEVGTFELRYFTDPEREIIATRMIEVLPVGVSLNAADTAPTGSDVAVTWTGPDYQRDYIAIEEVGGERYINYTYTSEGNTLMLQMPSEPGDYEIRYVLSQDTTVLATLPITVTDLEVRVIAQTEAFVGADATVGWEGPDYDGDYIAVEAVGGERYINYTYTSEGNPLQLEMPSEPGDYEIRYVLSQDSEVLASQPITVTPVKSELTIPDNAVAGETISVIWNGPGYSGDFIAVEEVGGDRYINYTYVTEGSPLGLEMPALPGDYEVRYVMAQNSTIIGREAITVGALKVQLVAEDTATAGTEIVVGWDGPDYPGDYIAISKPEDGRYETYAATSAGNPVTVRLPDEPGDYEIRYVMRQDSTIVARLPLTLE